MGPLLYGPAVICSASSHLTMRFVIMASSTYRSEVLPFCPQWIIHTVERNHMVNVVSSRIIAHFTHWTLSPLHSTDTLPLATISSRLLCPTILFFLLLAFLLPECFGCRWHHTSTPCTSTKQSTASLLPVLFTNLTVTVPHPAPLLPPDSVNDAPLFAAIT